MLILMLLILADHQRRLWADYFDGQGVRYAFFSAANAAALQQAQRDAVAVAEAVETGAGNKVHNGDEDVLSSESVEAFPESASDGSEEAESEDEQYEEESEKLYLPIEEAAPEAQDPRVKVLTVLELENLFVETAPNLSSGCPLLSPISSDRLRLNSIH